MGFPACYSEQILPRLLLHALILLGHFHRFLLWSFRAVGLGDLVDNNAPAATPAQVDAYWQSLQHRRPGFHRALAVEEALPALRLDELLASSPSVCAGGDCSVCLCGVGGADEVRRLPNCRHVFHRGCIDRWMAHDQRTCPLCRAPLMPGDSSAGPDPSAGIPDVYDYELSYPSPLPLTATPTLLRPHELLLSGLGGFQ
jgi:RING-H2 zinc finger protein RHA1